MKELPLVSVVIPTYNSGRTLKDCLESIKNQDYPKDKIEIIIADGGSTDNTITIAKKFKVNKILHNPFVIHPKGRALGIKKAKNELIACLDSDNILPKKDWLKKMVEPFNDKEIICSEPLYYDYSESDNIITKYCSLIGGDDPISIYLGYYDRFSLLTNKWTESKNITSDFGTYLKVKLLDVYDVPPLGANGFIVKKTVLNDVGYDPFFHVYIVHKILKRFPKCFIAKVKVGIVHKHSGNMRKFILKKLRRVKRRKFMKGKGQVYFQKFKKTKIFLLMLKLIFIFPILYETLIGYSRKPEKAWMIHPFITYTTFFAYIYGLFSKVKDRKYEKV